MSRIDETRAFLPVHIAILTVSDTRDEETDTSGDLLAGRVTGAGHVLVTLQDGRKALAATRLTLSARSISSQLVDNLNGSIHLRALLTDVFIVDEFLKNG